MATKTKDAVATAQETLAARISERDKVEAAQLADQGKADELKTSLASLHATAIRNPTAENEAAATQAENEMAALTHRLKGYDLALAAIDADIDQAEAAVGLEQQRSDDRQRAAVHAKARDLADQVDTAIAELARLAGELTALNEEFPPTRIEGKSYGVSSQDKMDVSKAVQDRLEVAGLVSIERPRNIFGPGGVPIPEHMRSAKDRRPTAATTREALRLDVTK